MLACNELHHVTIKTILEWALATEIDPLDAEVLLAHSLQVTRSIIHAYPERELTIQQEKQFRSHIQRRITGEPVAYITGHKEFWSLDLLVTPDTLIPRPETELLVEWALKKFPAAQSHAIADLGTGSGAIALALAHERSQWEIHATDRSPAALAIAKQNAARLQLANIKFYAGAWCAALPKINFSAIISNPPYIAAHDPELSASVATFEPDMAWLAADEGLADIQQIIFQAKNYLQQGGYLLLEHGSKQAAAVRQLLLEAGYENIETQRDFAGLERATSAQNTR